jgi:hypothetical protein
MNGREGFEVVTIGAILVGTLALAAFRFAIERDASGALWAIIFGCALCELVRREE